jgi:hypothetical protein
MYTGSCLCGNVRYELTAELGDFGYCHCTSCRKASGSAHAANAPISRAHFRLLGDAGRPADSSWVSGYAVHQTAAGAHIFIG